eukprot:scaffold39524_cov78-Phaeocystis_antarctica.AAC.3
MRFHGRGDKRRRLDRRVRAAAAICVAASRATARSLEGRRVRAASAICVAASCDAANSLEGRRVRAAAAICAAAAAAAACCWRSITHFASVCASVQSPFDEHSRIALRRSLPLVVFGTERSRKTRTYTTSAPCSRCTADRMRPRSSSSATASLPLRASATIPTPSPC